MVLSPRDLGQPFSLRFKPCLIFSHIFFGGGEVPSSLFFKGFFFFLVFSSSFSSFFLFGDRNSSVSTISLLFCSNICLSLPSPLLSPYHVDFSSPPLLSLAESWNQ